MNKLHKILFFLFKVINKIVIFISKGNKKLILSDKNNSFINFFDVHDFIFRPTGINYYNKILFVEQNYNTLYSVYKLIDKKYCDYIVIKSDRDFENIKKIYNYKIIVVNSEFNFLDNISKKHQIIVCIWHALGAFKKVGKYNSLVYKNEILKKYYESFFDFLIVSGSEIANLYSDAFNIEKKFVLPLGLPQVDKYFDNDYLIKKRKDFIKEFNFLKHKKIYGIFPTFQEKKHGIYWNINFKKLASYLNDDEIIVFKLHPSIPLSKTDFYEVENKIINLSHVKDLISLCEFESIITDYSSLIFEAMIFDINLVFLRNKYVESERELWINYENLPGNIIDTSASNVNLENAIVSNLRNNFRNKELYEKFYNENVGECDSKSSERIAKFLLDKLSENK